MELTIQKATALKEKPQDESNLGFGQIFTDHMFMMILYGGPRLARCSYRTLR